MNLIEVLKGKQQIEEKISALEKEYKNKLAELKKKESFYQEREEFLMKGGSEEVLELTKYIKFYNFPYFLKDNNLKKYLISLKQAIITDYKALRENNLELFNNASGKNFSIYTKIVPKNCEIDCNSCRASIVFSKNTPEKVFNTFLKILNTIDCNKDRELVYKEGNYVSFVRSYIKFINFEYSFDYTINDLIMLTTKNEYEVNEDVSTAEPKYKLVKENNKFVKYYWCYGSEFIYWKEYCKDL
jgi:hypothetical protein